MAYELKPGANTDFFLDKIEKLCIEACNIEPLHSPPSAFKPVINRQKSVAKLLLSRAVFLFFSVFQHFKLSQIL
jgi:hypothetical protein